MFLEIFVIPNILPFIYHLQEIIIHFEALSISNVSFFAFQISKDDGLFALFANDDISAPFMHLHHIHHMKADKICRYVLSEIPKWKG